MNDRDQTFLEAQAAGLLGRHVPDPPWQRPEPPTLEALRGRYRLLDDKHKAEILRRAGVIQEARTAKSRKSELAREIAEAKTGLIGVIGTAGEDAVVARIAELRSLIQPATDKLEAAEAALKALPEPGGPSLHDRQRALQALLTAVAGEELRGFEAGALHAAFAVVHADPDDWAGWLAEVLPPPSQVDLGALRAEVLQRHAVEV